MTLYGVATPIGNLGDLSSRAVDVLKSVDAIVAEDTRHTRGLLSHFDIHKPLLSLPAFDERARVTPLVERLQGGESLALVVTSLTAASVLAHTGKTLSRTIVPVVVKLGGMGAGVGGSSWYSRRSAHALLLPDR